MKTFKAICATMLLALSLSIPTYADSGEVHTPGHQSPVYNGTPDPKAGQPGTLQAGDVAFSVVADFMWALASIF